MHKYKYLIARYIDNEAPSKKRTAMMEEIARKAGVSQATVYRTAYQLKTKEKHGNQKVLRYFHRIIIGGKFNPDDLLA